MREHCDYCGRFMKHVWFRTGDHDDGWYDHWSCSRDPQHKIDFPDHFI